MGDTELIHRLQFGFTISYHYLFPQLTMGLAVFLVAFKALALRRRDSSYDEIARFWSRIFALNFAMGVVTGIPMEFQFGTNWARFSRFAGGVIGQTLAMEGMFAFFLESSFLGLFLFGERRLTPRAHLATAFAVFAGAWLSGYFIVATNAWMQHPVGYEIGPEGAAHLTSFWALVANPWALAEYIHTMGGATVTGAFACAGAWQIFPSGDMQGRLIAHHQPPTLSAMEGLFRTPPAGAPIVLIGQPNTTTQEIDNVLEVPRVLSFLTYRRWNAPVLGLDRFPPSAHPDNVALLYYSYHIMVGLGTILLALGAVALLALWRGRLLGNRPLLWCLMLAIPLPYVANTAGWTTAELGRQPWLVYGLLPTRRGASVHVSAGNALFTLLGFMGLYSALSALFLVLVLRKIRHGPEAAGPEPGAKP